MATLKNGLLRGVVGDTIFRVVNGKQIVSAKPKQKVKQTEKTKLASKDFGKAARITSVITQNLEEQLTELKELGMYGRLTGSLATVLKASADPEKRTFHFESDSFSILNGFEFNASYRLDRQLVKRPKIEFLENSIKVQFEDALLYPIGTDHCMITVCVSLFRPYDGLYQSNPMKQSLQLIRNPDARKQRDMEFQIPEGSLAIVSMFLRFTKATAMGLIARHPKKLNAGAILAAQLMSGVNTEQDNRIWIPMEKFNKRV